VNGSRWPAYAAAVWAGLFAAISLYRALGGMAGIATLAGRFVSIRLGSWTVKGARTPDSARGADVASPVDNWLNMVDKTPLEARTMRFVWKSPLC